MNVDHPETPPPVKKRRFFNDPTPQAKKPASPLPPVGVAADEPVELPSSNGSPSAPIDPPQDPDTDIPVALDGFDTVLFTSIIGEKLSADAITRLVQVSGGNMERGSYPPFRSLILGTCPSNITANMVELAINMYFDGSWKEKEAPVSHQSTIHFGNSLPQPSKKRKIADEGLSLSSGLSKSLTAARLIGTFGVEGWATRSGLKLLSFGEKVKIERQKINPPPSKGKGKASIASRRKTSDIVVRFTNSRGEEVGRIQQDKAVFISTLIDQKVCFFEGICFYAPERIRTNDTINLQLKCFLLPSAFDERQLRVSNDNRTPDLFASQETDDEKGLRLRQVSLVKIFEELNLHPVRTNEITAKHKRTGLLQAAEMAEQYVNAKAAESGTPGRESDTEDNEGKELEQDQLDALYRKAQAFDWNSPETKPADTFTLSLRRYQRQALYWLMSKEKDILSRENESMHPLWEEFIWPRKDEDGNELPSDGQENFYVNPYSGDLSLKFPRQEQHCLGGILADEMGLGKTIEMLSLIHTHKSQLAPMSSSSAVNLPKFQKSKNEVEFAPCTTLVVAPMSLLAQWQSEAEKASAPGTLKTLLYYGNDKNVNLQMHCTGANAGSAPNLVITSYGTVLSEFNSVAVRGGNRGDSGGLFSVKFFRVILDEGHHIKNRVSKTAKACYELSSEHRWVLTGTPIVNRLEDLFSLVRFLRVEPWSNFSFWRTFITVPFESKDFIRALDVVQTVLEPLVLRRTKDMKEPDGTLLVPLPPKNIIIEEIELSKQEREVYDHIFMRAKRTFAANVEAGTLMKSYTTIFAQILRLRQSCCHPALVRRKEVVADEVEDAAALDASTGFSDDMDLQDLISRFSETEDDGAKSANAYGAHVLKQIQEEAEAECPICAEEKMKDMVVTGCFHATCKKCLLDHIEYQKNLSKVPKCVTCRESINDRDIFEVLKEELPPDLASPPDTTPTPSASTHPLFSPPPSSTLLSNLTTSTPTTTPLPTTTITLRRLTSRSSAKIEALLGKLKSLRISHPTSKSTIFSQFTSFLDLLAPALNRARIPYLRFDGAMSQLERSRVLSKFQSHIGFMVLLISLRAGGVGLNLTQARWVFMMDPWWSFAVEAQAIDRVHRMGQSEEVTVWRFVVKDSVEERIVGKIQARKKFIASSLGMMSEEEKRVQRIEDIKDLLS